MSNLKHFLAFLFLFSLSFPFSIGSYESNVIVQPNGDLLVTEKMEFTLSQAYNEGFRAIRPEDFGTLSNIVIHKVQVNGQDAPYEKVMNGKDAEIVWKKTFAGKNNVELSYTLKNRVELWDDYAKACFEHYGANWPSSASVFRSSTALPEASRGKTMHFEVYSKKQGNAYVDDLSIKIELNNVPSGNYIGGCYLFAKDSVSTSNRKEGSAFAILKNEREIYGSKTLFSPEDDFPVAPCCCPTGFLLAILAGFLAFRHFSKPKLPESIMPPSSEEPISVAAIVNNKYSEKDILASAILELINKGVIDIMELEKDGYTGQEIKRERTILFLKKRPDTLKPYENAILDMIFQDGKKEVDLDALAKEFDSIKKMDAAKSSVIPAKMDLFSAEITKILKEKKLSDAAKKGTSRKALLTGFAFPIFFIGLCIFASFAVGGFDFLGFLLESGDYLYFFSILVGTFLIIASLPLLIFIYLQPGAPKGFEKEYSQWDAFARAVKASSLKGEPPSSALIWGEILVYATALGLADKVRKHLSELDSFLAQKIERMDRVRARTYVFYSSAFALRNLSKYGSRSGPPSSSGGFSGGSSGGWSSGGGGGFSGGSSGGGGFR